VNLTPEGYPNRPKYLQNLGTRYESLYKRTSQLNDLEKAIKFSRQAVELSAELYYKKPQLYAKLANKLKSLYNKTQQSSYLEKAFEAAKMACNLAPKDYPNLGGWLNTLGIILVDRYKGKNNIEDLEKAI
ncbi:hypothetical protein K432DRAFT_310596, partial [Lepidopterella palustris CBS 459.81]